jgi:hypothetical protein
MVKLNIILESHFVASSEFVDAVRKYVDLGRKHHLDFIIKNKNKIPAIFKENNRPLYRGMTFDEKTYNSVLQNGLTLKEPSSWTRVVNDAKSFVHDPDKRARRTGFGIVFKKKIPSSKIIMDFKGWYLGLTGMFLLPDDALESDISSLLLQEDEVVCDGGIKLTPKDIYYKSVI